MVVVSLSKPGYKKNTGNIKNAFFYFLHMYGKKVIVIQC